jgi:hypothetical protein
VVAGVGNIYADEALWLARIHPAARRVGPRRARALHAAIREVLAAAIEREGTTFRDYQMVNGASGRNADFLRAYGQAGLPCQRCGTALSASTVAGRAHPLLALPAPLSGRARSVGTDAVQVRPSVGGAGAQTPGDERVREGAGLLGIVDPHVHRREAEVGQDQAA